MNNNEVDLIMKRKTQHQLSEKKYYQKNKDKIKQYQKDSYFKKKRNEILTLLNFTDNTLRMKLETLKKYNIQYDETANVYY